MSSPAQKSAFSTPQETDSRDREEVGRVRLVEGLSTAPHSSKRSPLSSRFAVRLAPFWLKRRVAWMQTILYEFCSLYYRIREIHKKDLVLQFQTGHACQACLEHKIPQHCKRSRVCTNGIQQLRDRRYPWLSYVDMQLVVEGWDAAFESMPDNSDCGSWSEVKARSEGAEASAGKT